MVAYTAPVFWLFLLLVGISYFVLRHREPERERPFRAPLLSVDPRPVLPDLRLFAVCKPGLYRARRARRRGGAADRRAGGVAGHAADVHGATMTDTTRTFRRICDCIAAGRDVRRRRCRAEHPVQRIARTRRGSVSGIADRPLHPAGPEDGAAVAVGMRPAEDQGPQASAAATAGGARARTPYRPRATLRPSPPAAPASAANRSARD